MKNIVAVVVLYVSAVFSFGQTTAFTYQGRLNDASGPATGSYDLRFTIYDTLTGGAPVSGVITNAATSVSNGLFTVTLDFGAGVFTGAERWLEIGVRTNGASSFATLAPRQPVTSTPYAITASNVTGPLSSSALSGVYSNAVVFSNAANQFVGTFAGNGAGLSNVNALTLGGLGAGAFWKLTGNNVAPGQFVGSTNDQPVEIRANGQRALRLEPNTNGAPNVIAGSEVNQVDAGVVGSVISGGGATNYFGFPHPNRVSAGFSTVGGGAGNTVRGEFSAIVSGSANTIQTNGSFSVIGGGIFNTIQPNAGISAIGGGYGNVINEGVYYASIGGGLFNTNAAGVSVIGGGQYNTIQPFGDMSVIGGGWLNVIEANSFRSSIGGGESNAIAAPHSVVGGGAQNRIDPFANLSVIGGGWLNHIYNADQSVIAGGNANAIFGLARESFIGGGFANAIQTNAGASFIGGGVLNTNAGLYGMIGGGAGNMIGAGASLSTIAGGENNLIQPNASYATIAGGQGNTNAGARAAIGGGIWNVISTNTTASTIAGGSRNAIINRHPVALTSGSTIGGGALNTIEFGSSAVIAGGDRNFAGLSWTVIGGGLRNTNLGGTIGGGSFNFIQTNAGDSVIGGGTVNTIQSNAFYSAIAGGQRNTIGTNADSATIGGGAFNDIETGAVRATIAGGEFQTIRAGSSGSTISGGSANLIESNVLLAAIAGGQLNTIRTGARGAALSGGMSNIVGGRFAVVPGGLFNSATGAFSFAGGVNASARHNGAFVWADSLGTNFSSTASNQFLIRASGGVGINTTNPTTALEVVGSVKAGGFMDNGSGFTGNGGGLTNVNAATLGGLRSSNFWQLNGNNVAAGQFLGSTNNRAVDVRVNNQRALRLEPTAGAPNLIGGADVNAVAAGVTGATIDGGLANTIGANSGLATVGGGQINVIGIDSHESTIGGGYRNTIETFDSTIAGGAVNTIQTNSSYSTIAGGTANRILAGAQLSSIGGGSGNVVDTNATFATIPGGTGNRIEVSAGFATIGGGANNRAAATRATVSGGSDNWIQTNALASTIGGGMQNLIMENAPFGTIAGGNGSRIENGALASAIGGGQGNTISENAIASVVAGGTGNNIARDSMHSVIGGGVGNEIDIDTDSATIDGGEFNRIADQAKWSSIGGGYGNVAEFTAQYGSIGGGRENRIGSFSATATVAGGSNNFAGAASATVGGGHRNASPASAATVPGGEDNVAGGEYSFAAGRRAKANHPGSFVWADSQNADFSSTGVDQFNLRAFGGVRLSLDTSNLSFDSPNSSILFPSTFGANAPMIYLYPNAGNASRMVLAHSPPFPDWGLQYQDSGDKFHFLGAGIQVMTVDLNSRRVGVGTNTPQQQLSVAAGMNIDQNDANNGATGNGLTFGSNSGEGIASKRTSGGNQWGLDFYTGFANRMTILNNGDVGIGTTPQQKLHVNGNILASGTVCANNGFQCISDRDAKTGFAPVDAKAILEKVAALSITRWRYTNDTATPHIGPVAQDFHAAFGVGSNDKQISTVDADGVALAAIQGLNQKLEEKDSKISVLEKRLADLEKLVSRLANNASN